MYKAEYYFQMKLLSCMEYGDEKPHA